MIVWFVLYKSLTLKNHGIGPKFAEALARVLARGDVEELHLSGNRLRGRDAFAFSARLQIPPGYFVQVRRSEQLV